MKAVRLAAKRLAEARESVVSCEKQLQIAVAAVIEQWPEGQNAWARAMGITYGYASDLRNMRRKVSLTLLEKMLKPR